MPDMNVIKKTSSGYQSLSLDAILLDKRMIFLSGSITSVSVELIIKQLLFLESIDSREPVKLIINSPGGEVDAGLILYQQIKGMELPIQLYCMETAASMAAIIFAGGKYGRYILKSGRVMFHEPLITSTGNGMTSSASQVVRTAETILKTKRHLNELFAADTRNNMEDIEKLAEEGDKWFTADEAVAYGICDAVVERL